jgi:CRP-like cAMP-binding protein
MALIDDEPRSATARVTQPAQLLVLTKDRFERIGTEHPRLALLFTFTVARLLSKRLRLASGMLVDHLG